jgi:hypothetical protein
VKLGFALVVLVALAGCGREDDERAVSTVTARFLAALEAGEGERACARLTRDAAESLAATRACAEVVTDLGVSPGRVTRGQVSGIGAKVEVAGGQSFFLELTRAGWRIAAAGCVPKTGDEPFDCDAEG